MHVLDPMKLWGEENKEEMISLSKEVNGAKVSWELFADYVTMI